MSMTLDRVEWRKRININEYVDDPYGTPTNLGLRVVELCSLVVVVVVFFFFFLIEIGIFEISRTLLFFLYNYLLYLLACQFCIQLEIGCRQTGGLDSLHI